MKTPLPWTTLNCFIVGNLLALLSLTSGPGKIILIGISGVAIGYGLRALVDHFKGL